MNKYIPSLAIASLLTTTQSIAQDRPNIILFLVDDMGVMDTSVPFLTDAKGKIQTHPLNEWYRTPNMERNDERTFGSRESALSCEIISQENYNK